MATIDELRSGLADSSSGEHPHHGSSASDPSTGLDTFEKAELPWHDCREPSRLLKRELDTPMTMRCSLGRHVVRTRWFAVVVYSVLACTFVLLTGCSERERVGSISGRVLDTATLAPVARCSLALAGRSVLTAADGAFAFLDVEEGSYVVTATADAYETATANVTIRDDSQSSRDIKLMHRSNVRDLAAVSRSASSAAEAAGPLVSIEDAWRAARAYLLLEYFPRVFSELAPAFGAVFGYEDIASVRVEVLPPPISYVYVDSEHPAGGTLLDEQFPLKTESLSVVFEATNVGVGQEASEAKFEIHRELLMVAAPPSARKRIGRRVTLAPYEKTKVVCLSPGVYKIRLSCLAETTVLPGVVTIEAGQGYAIDWESTDVWEALSTLVDRPLAPSTSETRKVGAPGGLRAIVNPARPYTAGELEEIQVERVVAGPVGQACEWYIGVIRALHEALCALPGQPQESAIMATLEAKGGEAKSPIEPLWKAELWRLWSVVNSCESIPAPLPDALTPAAVTAELFPFAAAVECDKP